MERTESQTRILESALYLFSSKGYASTTTRQIAEKASVNELTIFRNFNTKENLLSEVIDHGINTEEIQNSLDIETTGDVEEDLVNLVLILQSQIRKRSKIYALMLREMGSNETVKRKLQQFPTMIKGIMLSKLEEILDSHQRKDIDIETAGIFLASYYLRSEFMRILLGKDPFHDLDERRIREAVSIFLHGYLYEGVGS